MIAPDATTFAYVKGRPYDDLFGKPVSTPDQVSGAGFFRIMRLKALTRSPECRPGARRKLSTWVTP
jgi:hypothetical protein